MRLLAGLSAAAFVYLLVGLLVGLGPTRTLNTARRQPRRGGAEWQDWLHQSGVLITPAQLVGACAALGLSAGFVVWLITGVFPLALLAVVSGAALPVVLVSNRRRALVSARAAAWPDALRDLMTHLRAGASVHAGLCLLADSGPLPLRPYFRRYEVLAGALDQRAALEVVREELAEPMSDRIVEILLVAFDQGPSVVLDILDGLATASTADLRLSAEIDTAQLETKLEARGAAVLPFVVLAMLCATSPDYRAFYQSPAGWLVMGLGGGLAFVGLVVISRLGRTPREHRILAGSTP